MSHNLEQFEDGTAAFFTAREVAWHKLGTVTTDALTAEDALKTAYLDWQVFKSENPVSTMVPMLGNSAMEENSMEEITFEDKFMTYRYHPKTQKADALGVVGSRYTPVQNSEAFSLLNYIADESGAVFETAGSLNSGRKVFMTMKLPNQMTIGGVDAIDMYLMAWNTHDGTSSFNLLTTPIRVVCQNTLSMAINGAKSSFALRHTTNVQGKVQEAREALQLAWQYTDAFAIEAEELLAQKLSTNDYAKIVEKLIPIDETVDRKRSLAEEARGALMSLWNAPTQENVAGTKWAAWNAVVEYADWAKPVRGNNADVKRAERIVTGAGDAFKNKALQLIK